MFIVILINFPHRPSLNVFLLYAHETTKTVLLLLPFFSKPDKTTTSESESERDEEE
jgi:hypothetical protein